KLQKMIYLVYADYLLKTKKALFDEQIIAMQYGPLIPEVYDAYKVHGRDEIETDSKKVILDEITLPMALAKILQADDSKA
ncbi:Panacea domain-containing protein, partial [Streptococcus pyogenes]